MKISKSPVSVGMCLLRLLILLAVGAVAPSSLSGQLYLCGRDGRNVYGRGIPGAKVGCMQGVLFFEFGVFAHDQAWQASLRPLS